MTRLTCRSPRTLISFECSCPSRSSALDESGPASLKQGKQFRRFDDERDQWCGRRDATANDPSNCAACPLRSCWCGGRKMFERQDAATLVVRIRFSYGPIDDSD